jgi:1-acyl-sn-glycerol-3-phosphate acyltransferase
MLAGFAVAVVLPFLPRPIRESVIQGWAIALLGVLGVELEAQGEWREGAVLIVANHVSWLDILAICALRPAVFVCKSEIEAWPALGWLLRRAGTIFLRRGSARAASEAAGAAAQCLRSGLAVAAFPEGTSSSGGTVLPFHGALFQAALDAGAPVQPVALQYSSEAAVYAGETAFGDSLIAVTEARDLVVRLVALPAFAAADRREAARRAHALIGACLKHMGTFPAEAGHALVAEGGLAPLEAGGHRLG